MKSSTGKIIFSPLRLEPPPHQPQQSVQGGKSRFLRSGSLCPQVKKIQVEPDKT